MLTRRRRRVGPRGPGDSRRRAPPHAEQQHDFPQPAIFPQCKSQAAVDRWKVGGSRIGQDISVLQPVDRARVGSMRIGAEEDVNRAVAAARRAFEGPWSRFKPRERQAVLLKLAQLIEANFDELAMLDTIDMGMPVSFTPYMKPVLWEHTSTVRAQAFALEGETLPNSSRGRYLLIYRPRACRGGRRDHSLEWPRVQCDLEDRPGARDGVYVGAQSGGASVLFAVAARRDLSRGRRTARGDQCDLGLR